MLTLCNNCHPIRRQIEQPVVSVGEIAWKRVNGDLESGVEAWVENRWRVCVRRCVVVSEGKRPCGRRGGCGHFDVTFEDAMYQDVTV